MDKDKLAQFDGEKYISLRTFKKNGEGVDTPVWFAESNNILYTYTLETAWKVKRIRNNPKIQVAPCTMRGQVTGEWVDGKARILDDAEAGPVDKMITRKYGWQKKIGDIFRKFKKTRREYISIQLD